MHPIEPVPFFLPAPGRDTVGLDGIRSTSHTVTGLLHADAEQLMFEWSTLRQAR